MKKIIFLFAMLGFGSTGHAHDAVINQFGETLNRAYEQRHGEQSVHALDGFVRDRGGEYLGAMERMLPIARRDADPYEVIRARLMGFLDRNEHYGVTDVEGNYYQGGHLRHKINQAIDWLGGKNGSPYGYRRDVYGSVNLYDIAQRTAYYLSLPENPDHYGVEVLMMQLADAHGTCLQGQTNRMMISLHNLFEGELRGLDPSAQIARARADYRNRRADEMTTARIASSGDRIMAQWDVHFGACPTFNPYQQLGDTLAQRLNGQSVRFNIDGRAVDVNQAVGRLRETMNRFEGFGYGLDRMTATERSQLNLWHLSHNLLRVADLLDTGALADMTQMLLDCGGADVTGMCAKMFLFTNEHMNALLRQDQVDSGVYLNAPRPADIDPAYTQYANTIVNGFRTQLSDIMLEAHTLGLNKRNHVLDVFGEQINALKQDQVLALACEYFGLNIDHAVEETLNSYFA